ncbi:TetR/AcrR family transcriptional regulator [Roseovarius autotrophicus]|uniref:TetR/AcrR family transcriptional regulator n=1 Tax=Roseovarius autotrophicus TaxID=2824121 RepID=UPI001A01A2E7|nr:TetR/AcrR family transcriptional regulator [Roseovarius autotrophicus]MBE0452262.1 TetR/AcrR family transcriptional regulator [Roseovarius sp.]
MARTQGSHSDITGPRVRETALRLFARQGYAAVSMRQIAGEVGVQAGALYNYTPDKQTLLFDLMRTHMEDLLADWDAEAPKGGARDALEAFTRFHIRFNTRRADAVFVSYMELRNLEPDNFAVIERLRRAYETRLETILRQGVAEGVFAVAEPRIAAMALIAMLTGVNTWFRERGRLSLTQVEALYWDMVRKAVAA